jgi:hypothetical protein
MGTEVAVKKFFEIDDDNYDMEKYVLREVTVLKSLHHPNIVQFIGITVTDVIVVADLRGVNHAWLRNLSKVATWTAFWPTKASLCPGKPGFLLLWKFPLG